MYWSKKNIINVHFINLKGEIFVDINKRCIEIDRIHIPNNLVALNLIHISNIFYKYLNLTF